MLDKPLTLARWYIFTVCRYLSSNYDSVQLEGKVQFEDDEMTIVCVARRDEQDSSACPSAPNLESF